MDVAGFLGLRLVSDPKMTPGVMEFRSGGAVVCRIVNIGVAPAESINVGWEQFWPGAPWFAVPTDIRQWPWPWPMLVEFGDAADPGQ